MNKNIITINGNEWLETKFGFYTIESGILFFAYETNDIEDDKNIIEVSDLTGLTTEQYDELNNVLSENFNYELSGEFV